MGNTFSRCWRNVCVPPSFTEDGSAEWTESVEWTDLCDPASCEEGTELSEDRSAPSGVVGDTFRLSPARGHDEQDIELEDVLPEDILSTELSEDRSAPSGVVGDKFRLSPARGHDEQDMELEDVLPEDILINLPCELEDKKQTNDVDKSDCSQTSDVGASSLHQTSDVGASSLHQTSVANNHSLIQASSPKLGVAPVQPAHSALIDGEQTQARLKAQEKQTLLKDDYSHLSEVDQHLLHKREAALQEEMQRVFPQETITSLLPELQRTTQREIQQPFLQQIEYCALLDRQEEELVTLDKQLEREKLNHNIMFVLSQDCSKPSGIKEGQAERFGNRKRRHRNGTTQNSEADHSGGRHRRSKAVVRGRKQLTGIG